MTNKKHLELERVLNLLSATMMGLGSILGTGVFVSIGLASGVTGPSVILAIVIAALVATCNALSSAQLAANHPVSGGTYEYGYRYLHPSLGFTAGWMFLCAKIASAATAALGFAGYFLHLINFHNGPNNFLASLVVIALTFIVLSGIKRSNRANLLIVSITLVSLLIFILSGLPNLFQNIGRQFTPFFPQIKDGLGNFFYATALMFVAYTGYGRIATLGEEVKEPKYTIPKAIILTLIISASFYILVALVAIGSVGANQLWLTTKYQATPLETAARAMRIPGLTTLIALGACTAMLSVLLNLILGLSRVVLAMGRRGDLPRFFAFVSRKNYTPIVAIASVGILIAGFTLLGSVELTWSFSSFTVLIYYFITNLAALYLPKEERMYPQIIAAIGLIACSFLAFWVPLAVWVSGLILILLGLVWHALNAYYLRKT
ncbi:amino acid ABC transporter system permease [Legionella busanensis]|uniref:Amino acid ABC transporter system permease n=1 Tax=Legionella busanensis TaxID=190655 RepID=A0A378KAE4_9GAMM|nr:APC family permease [Legionella busanensis]STX81687.1 amino acid ABC transporter system permease [Legionella busanensis]